MKLCQEKRVMQVPFLELPNILEPEGSGPELQGALWKGSEGRSWGPKPLHPSGEACSETNMAGLQLP